MTLHDCPKTSGTHDPINLTMNNLTNFDAVIMLTWSDWHTEPRSNRYHYATRLARELPVYFVQRAGKSGEGLGMEPSEIENLTIMYTTRHQVEGEVEAIKKFLYIKGIRRPLLWIYDSISYQPLIDALPQSFRVYHATEDYLNESGAPGSNSDVKESIKRILSQTDLVVGCSESVVESYKTLGGYTGIAVTVENGCDAEYFLSRIPAPSGEQSGKRKIAIFQGGVNQRLDFELLFQLAKRMPDWEFRICGKAMENRRWSKLRRLENLNYLGEVTVEELAANMHEADVGIIPFVKDSYIFNSLPLKAYEYVSCGLPVVTVPIKALQGASHLFAIAKDAEEFETAMRLHADSRHDSAMLEKRRHAALRNSYDVKFKEMKLALVSAARARENTRMRRKVAVIYDSVISMHVNTIREHLEAFERYSENEIVFIPGTSPFWAEFQEGFARGTDLSVFDCVVVHYSIRVSVLEHLDEGVAKALERYHGLKILFLQDEYEGTETARRWMDRLRFDLVYTCVPEESLDYVYPTSRFPTVDFLPTLTGYVPEDNNLERYTVPLQARESVIAYRGRMLPFIYGQLGREKYLIGREMKRLAEARGLAVDIEVDDSKRIYGSKWYEFLGSSRATLATESGANVFDFDGSLKEKIAQASLANPQIEYDEVASRFLREHEGRVRMNQISPKVFEAIRLRTALILFEGEYSGVVRPNEHFIPLKKDFSNVDEVFEKLMDDEFLESLTTRAYREIIESGKFSYRQFIQDFDRDLTTRVLHVRRNVTLIRPLMYLSDDDKVMQVLPLLPVGPFSGLAMGEWRAALVEWSISSPPAAFSGDGSRMRSKLRRVRQMLTARDGARQFMRYFWVRLPPDIQDTVRKLVKRP